MRALVSCLLLGAACSQPATSAETPPGTPPEAQGSASNDAKPASTPATLDAPPTPPDAKAPIAADARAELGAPAPDFTLTDISGKPHRLADYAGKTVVLEWFNPQCPFVNHAHTEGSLVSMAKEQTERGVVWLAINSGARGKQGHGTEANLAGAKKFGLSHPILQDETGAVGHAYGAKKTPHVYLIDPAGTLVYQGAIDNAPFGEVDGDGPKVNLLAAALTELEAGKAVATPQTAPYGCTVKY